MLIVKVEGMELSTRNGTDNGTIPNGNHVTKDTVRKVPIHKIHRKSGATVSSLIRNLLLDK